MPYSANYETHHHQQLDLVNNTKFQQPRSSATDVLLPNIFVQIPIHSSNNINSQPLRRNPHQQNNEIKSEPIKSEIENSSLISQNPANTSSTTANPTASDKEPSHSQPLAPQINVCIAHQQQLQSSIIDTSSLVTARPKNTTIKCFKCTSCPFISISQSGLDQHVKANHRDNNGHMTIATTAQRKLTCPGCENVFYCKKSLKTHLFNDHQMSQAEIRVLLQSLLLYDEDNLTDGSTDTITTSAAPSAANSAKITIDTPTKHKIYLKNVEVLKNPIADPISNELYNCHFSNNDLSADMMPPIDDFADSLPDPIDFINLIDDDQWIEDAESVEEIVDEGDYQNKIYVKSDNMLRNPMPYYDVMDYNNFLATHILPDYVDMNQQINVIETPPPPTTPQNQNFDLVDNNQLMNNDYNHSKTSNVPQRKIFIKNVDILKQPILLQSNGCHSISPQPQQYFVQQDTGISSASISPASFNGNTNTDFVTASPHRLSDNATPLNIVQPKNKIFIKNIDILTKPISCGTSLPLTLAPAVTPPQPEVRRNSIHLRTVDQRNLMIDGGNLSGNFHGSDQQHCLDSVIQDLEMNYQNDKFQYPMQVFQEIPENCFGGDSNLMDDGNHGYSATTEDVNVTGVGDNQQHLMFKNITDSITSSIDEMANKTEPRCASNYTPPESASQMYYATSGGYMEMGQKHCNESAVLESSMVMPSASYGREFDEDIMFAEELINASSTTAEQESLQTNDTSVIDCEVPIISPAKLEAVRREDCRTEIIAEPTKGRIYVVGNLMKTPSADEPDRNSTVIVDESNDSQKEDDPVIVIIDTEKPPAKQRKSSIRQKGRRKIVSKVNANDPKPAALHKCTLDCAMQFKNPDLLTFHLRCHDPGPPNRIICPECLQQSSVDFRNWNTLHTHLWRVHAVDMELYSCTQCNFKTPMLSRMINTHMKIHSDERNFKCDQCEKAFKNTKQLKNHRRIHSEVVAIQQCEKCDTLFYSQKHLRNHIRSIHDKQVEYKCDICDCIFSSIKARQTHMLNHEKATKLKCPDCVYTSNDNNAYRRHRMTHNEKVMYHCPCCPYKSIQSTTYAKHILKEHPIEAKEIVFSCTQCKFISVNKRRFELHLLNHEIGKGRTVSLGSVGNCSENDAGVADGSESCKLQDGSALILNFKNKIKVKSKLSLTASALPFPSNTMDGHARGSTVSESVNCVIES